MKESVLTLFEGLTDAEAKIYSTRLLLSAKAIRAEIRPLKRAKTKNDMEAGMKATAELQRIEAEIEAVQAQQEDLRKAGLLSGATIAKHEDVLTREVVDDKKIDASVAVIMREKARVAGTEHAQAELSDKLAALAQEKRLQEARIAIDNYERAIAQMDGEVTGIFRTLFSLRKALADLNDGGPSYFRAPHGVRLPAGASSSEAAARVHSHWELLEDFKLDIFLRDRLSELELKQPDYYKEIRDAE